MPKQRITKETVVNAAFEIARSSGMEAVIVKNIADRIGCSVQPIYSYCKNMDGLRKDVTDQINYFVHGYITAHIDKNDMFGSMGKAYIQLAKDEPHMFKIYILHERDGVSSFDDLYRMEASRSTAEFIADSLNISIESAKQLHLNMLIYTIGIGTIFAVAKPGISTDEIYRQQETAYEAFLRQAVKKDEKS